MKSRKVAIPIEPSDKVESIPVDEEKPQVAAAPEPVQAPSAAPQPSKQAEISETEQKPKSKRRMTDAKLKALEKANKARQEKLFLRKQAQEQKKKEDEERKLEEKIMYLIQKNQPAVSQNPAQKAHSVKRAFSRASYKPPNRQPYRPQLPKHVETYEEEDDAQDSAEYSEEDEQYDDAVYDEEPAYQPPPKPIPKHARLYHMIFRR